MSNVRTTRFVPLLGLMSLAVSSAVASPILVSATASQMFTTTASAQYTVSGNGNGTATGTFNPTSGTYTMSGTFSLAGYTAPAGLDGGKLYLDLTQTGVNFGPIAVVAGTCTTHGGSGAQCGTAPSFNSTSSSYFLQISSGAGTVSFPVSTFSASNLDISVLANDFVAGHPFTITIVQKDVFTQSSALTNWVRADRTYTISQSMSTIANAIVHGEYTPPPEEVPEPAAAFLFGGGLVALRLYRRFLR
jgi:hypothetical protein